jgi:hypothetical protein
MGGRLQVRRVALPTHVIITPHLDVGDPAEFPRLDDLIHRFDQMRRAAALHADLHHPLEFRRGRQHRRTFDHIHTGWLLHVNVRPRSNRFDHRQRVPMVRGFDQHDVEVLLRQHLPVVAMQPGRLA